MATLKIRNEQYNLIWVTNVKRVEQMLFVTDFVKTHSTDEPWMALTRAIDELKDTNKTLYQTIVDRQTSYPNHCAVKAPFENSPTNLLYLYVETEELNGDSGPVGSNWLVLTGQNYLLENGKTVDRI